MIKLYDFELSGSCYKVRLLLNILKVSCERIPVDFVRKEHKTERFLKLNPLGEIPVLEDGDVLLRDAQAILVYIARTYDRSNTWFPDAPDSMTLGSVPNDGIFFCTAVFTSVLPLTTISVNCS